MGCSSAGCRGNTGAAGNPPGGVPGASWRTMGTSSPDEVRPTGAKSPERSATRASARRPATAPDLSASAPRIPIEVSSSVLARSGLPVQSARTPNSWWKYASSATSPAILAASWPILRARSQAPQPRPAAKAGEALRASRTAALAAPASSPGTSRVREATIASASATARSGVTEGCEAHQA